MIVVKLKSTLRVHENGKKVIKPAGLVFRESKREKLPKWLLDEIEYCQKTIACDTLIITETQEIEQGTAPVIENDTKLKLNKRVK